MSDVKITVTTNANTFWAMLDKNASYLEFQEVTSPSGDLSYVWAGACDAGAHKLHYWWMGSSGDTIKIDVSCAGQPTETHPPVNGEAIPAGLREWADQTSFTA